MKKVSVIVLVVVGLLFAGYAEAAKPRKRTRNANRIGPYAGFILSQTSYTADHSDDEAFLEDQFADEDIETQNLEINTEDTDIGYQAMFGYRFLRYFAAEIGLAQFGDLVSTARADVLFEGETEYVPASIKLNTSIQGPVFSAIGILPVSDKFEFFGRVGLLFAGTKIEAVQRVEGDVVGYGSGKGDSTEVVLGAGFAWNLSQVYSIRLEYQQIDGIGESGSTSKQDLSMATAAFVVRF